MLMIPFKYCHALGASVIKFFVLVANIVFNWNLFFLVMLQIANDLLEKVERGD